MTEEDVERNDWVQLNAKYPKSLVDKVEYYVNVKQLYTGKSELMRAALHHFLMHLSEHEFREHRLDQE